VTGCQGGVFGCTHMATACMSLGPAACALAIAAIWTSHAVVGCMPAGCTSWDAPYTAHPKRGPRHGDQQLVGDAAVGVE
jgi:hypothetical protein